MRNFNVNAIRYSENDNNNEKVNNGSVNVDLQTVDKGERSQKTAANILSVFII